MCLGRKELRRTWTAVEHFKKKLKPAGDPRREKKSIPKEGMKNLHHRRLPVVTTTIKSPR